jgi:hypothetical protein
VVISAVTHAPATPKPTLEHSVYHSVWFHYNRYSLEVNMYQILDPISNIVYILVIHISNKPANAEALTTGRMIQ